MATPTGPPELKMAICCPRLPFAGKLGQAALYPRAEIRPGFNPFQRESSRPPNGQ